MERCAGGLLRQSEVSLCCSRSVCLSAVLCAPLGEARQYGAAATLICIEIGTLNWVAQAVTASDGRSHYWKGARSAVVWRIGTGV